jgi:hypothetical protein
MFVDREWVRIDDGGSTVLWAKNVRTDSGMVIGCVERAGAKYLARRFERGAFVGLGEFASIKEAAAAIVAGHDLPIQGCPRAPPGRLR